MKIAVEGCMHGDLNIVYKTIQHTEKLHGIKIDIPLCCGDSQAVRNERYMESLSVPPKYREMKSFWKYYVGQEVAPVPIIFIGRNHEASNYLWELYVGFAGVVKLGNIRIGGVSGIYNARHYHLGHFERPPYNESTIKSVYHVREYDVHKLMQVEEPIDIFISHDWPLGITDSGNWKQLLRFKQHFENENQERTLGSKAAAQLLEKLKRSYWFLAYLHCKFAAVVQHGESGPVMKFLALDKCLPGHKFLGTQFELQDFQQWVRSRLEARGAKPLNLQELFLLFILPGPNQTIPFLIVQGILKQSLLQLLELPYLLDSTSESIEPTHSPVLLSQGGPYAENSEEIPIDGVDELEKSAEVYDVEIGNE